MFTSFAYLRWWTLDQKLQLLCNILVLDQLKFLEEIIEWINLLFILWVSQKLCSEKLVEIIFKKYIKYTDTCTHTYSWKEPESVIVKAVKSDFIQELL